MPRAVAGVIGVAFLLTGAAWLHTPKEPTAPVSKGNAPFAPTVQRDGRALRVSWDRNSEAIRQSNHATLHIADGSRNSQLELNAAETRVGRLVYWPETDGATFRLEVSGGASTPQASSPPIVAQRDAPVEEKPSPFNPRGRRQKVQLVSVTTEPADPAPQPTVPETKPAGLLGRLAHRIPLVRRFEKSGHRPTASSD